MLNATNSIKMPKLHPSNDFHLSNMVLEPMKSKYNLRIMNLNQRGTIYLEKHVNDHTLERW